MEKRLPVWALITTAIQGPVLLVAEMISVISLVSDGDGSFARKFVIGSLIGGSLFVFLVPVIPWVK